MSTNVFYLALSAMLVAGGVSAAEKRVKMESLPPARRRLRGRKGRALHR